MVFSVPMDTQFMDKVEGEYVKRDPDIRPGDTVNVHLRITEAGKERIQQFEGMVISVKGGGLSKMITVRKISHGVGVEKILPVNSPMIKKIDVEKRGNVRRSKLYYMRDKIGKRSLDVTLDEHFESIMEEEEGEVAKDAEEKEEVPEEKEVKKKEEKEEKEEKPEDEKPEEVKKEEKKAAKPKDEEKDEKKKPAEVKEEDTKSEKDEKKE